MPTSNDPQNDSELAPNHNLKIEATAIGAIAVGAFALGALAIGALAIGAVAVGALSIGEGRVRKLVIDELWVGKLDVNSSVGQTNN